MRMPRCKICKTEFIRLRPLQTICTEYKCIMEQVAANKAKKLARDAKTARKVRKEGLEKLKTLRKDYIPAAQKAFNAYIRARDSELPCISCDRVIAEQTVGGAWDCGHFLSVGSHPELRFEPMNAAKQCKKCNGGAGKWAKKDKTVTEAYEAELISRIGQDKVNWLKGPHAPAKLSIEQVKGIEALYKQKLKDIT